VEVVPLEELEEVEQPLASNPALAANILPEAELRRRSRTAPVAIGLLILLLCVGGTLFWAFGRTKQLAAVPTVASAPQPEASAALTAASAIRGNAELPGPAEVVADAGIAEEPTPAATRPESPESRRSARPDKPEDRPAEGVQAPARTQKGFRPSGI
jgi:hypothetical protein